MHHSAPADPSRRRSTRGEPEGAPGIELRGEVWHLRSYAAVRQVLREAEGTRQAGFNSESMPNTGMKKPVLFQDGAAHKEQRTAIARFFTPKTVSDDYRALMEELADEAIAELVRAGGGDLGRAALGLAVQVAARVVGLTDSSRPGLERRLDALLSIERLGHAPLHKRLTTSVQSHARMLHFYLRDVRPAIAARRAHPREDVISHLLERDYRDMEILIECITYGAAGMATTREFIAMAAWHLLEDEALRDAYLAADESGRHLVLQEILRLEPVVGHLYRRATRDLRLEDGGATYEIPAGAMLDLNVRAANVDPRAVGREPARACPQRELARGVQPPGLSFGDGGHRCPGAFIAIQESDLFLQRLLRLDVDIVRRPDLTWNDLIESYEVRGFGVVVHAASHGGAST